jgi:hypothetical protein
MVDFTEKIALKKITELQGRINVLSKKHCITTVTAIVKKEQVLILKNGSNQQDLILLLNHVEKMIEETTILK